jgi:tetratricopeptide (TPR) repeat protein
MGTHKHSEVNRYAAFISYAHADEAIAARLHKALETYPVPRHLRAQGKTTKPVFRDVAELTAAHSLSEKIREAVKGSRVLIVLCSPAAKASHWVNEEICLFRELHGDAAILSAIIDGTPETAFPYALVEDGREPLAAALGADKAGFKLGVTQLAAGLLGTGLDELIQRGAKRRQRIMGAGLAASLVLSGVMSFTTLQAVEARKEAESARGDAEGLVEYMIKDLKFKLEPVGRLDLLEGIGDKAVEYYDKQEIKQLPDDSLTRQAAARQVLAQVHLDAGRMEEAQREIEASAGLTRVVLERNPDNADAIFAHAQSEFWVGKYHFDQNQFAEVDPYWKEYDRLSKRLFEIDPNNFDWIMEAAWSANAMGAYYDRQKKYIEASKKYENAANFIQMAIVKQPHNFVPQRELPNILAGQARASLNVKSFEEINDIRLALELLYDEQLKNEPENKSLIFASNLAKFNRYFELTRFHNNQEIHILHEVIESLDSLVALDTSNQNWVAAATSAKGALLDFYFLNGDNRGFLEFYKDYQTTAAKMFAMDLKKDKLYQLPYEINDIRFSFLIGDKHAVSEKAHKLNANRLEIEITGQLKVFDAWLMINNQKMGRKKDAEIFANKYLEHFSGASNIQTPSVLNYTVIAYAIIGDCDTAKGGVQSLTERNFRMPPIYVDRCL